MTNTSAEIRDRVVIFDDDEEKARDWEDRLRPQLEDRLLRCPLTKLRQDLEQIETRRERARARKEIGPLEGTVFDRAEVLIVDYDLFALNQTTTGDFVAYLARCFSNCGLIIGVNQDRTSRWFDLTLRDHPTAFTDVSVGAEHLATSTLWRAPTEAGVGISGMNLDQPGFRPWSWPLLLPAARDLELCVADLARCDRATVDVLHAVGIDDEHRGLLPREVTAVVQVSGEVAPRVATLGELTAQTALGSRFAKDVIPDECQPRVIAARLRKWLETLLLTRQDTIVDAPHLATRIPGVLHASAVPASWQATCVLHVDFDSVAVDAERLRASQFAAGPWLSRPTWWWPDVASAATLDDLRDVDVPDEGLVFCEDISAFAPANTARPFASAVDGNYTQRWVRYVRDPSGRPAADYEPAVRLVG